MKPSTDHEDSPARQPCAIEVHPLTRQDRWTIGCRTHRCDARADYPAEASARAAFCCDRRARWWFIVHHLDDDSPPDLVDLTGLAEEVRTYVQNVALGEHCLLVVWRYLDGRCVAVDVEITTVGQDEWLIHIRDDGADALRAGREPQTYLTLRHVLE